MRPSTAVHLLQAGVDQNVIKAWLGHADVSTTGVYLDLGIEETVRTQSISVFPNSEGQVSLLRFIESGVQAK